MKRSQNGSRAVGRCGALGEAGQALAEMAIVLPFVLLLFVGVLDFCRVFYTSMMLTQAARSGAQYGAQAKGKSADYATMVETAVNAASDLSPAITASAVRSCECSGGTTVDCTTGDCGAEGAPRVFVSVTTGYTFNTFFPYPGVPTNIALSRTATLMVP